MTVASLWRKSAPTIVGIILTLTIVGTGLTAINSWEVRQSQDDHTAELHTISQLEHQVAIEGAAIERYAVHLEDELRTTQGATYRIVVQLCHETPGCVAPPGS